MSAPDDSSLAVWKEGLRSFFSKDYTKALSRFEQVEPLLQGWAVDPELKSFAGLTANHAFLAAYRLGQFERALHYASREHEFSSDDMLESRALNNKGLALFELGRLTQAQDCFVQALNKLDAVPLQDHLATHRLDDLRETIQNHIGLLAEARGLPVQAPPARISIQSWLPTPADEATTLLVNRGVWAAQEARNSGDFTRAVEIWLELLKTLRERDADPRVVGITLSNLGSTRRASGDLAGAKADLQASIAILETLPRPSEPLARALHNLGETLMHLRDRAGALDATKRAWLEIKEAAPETPLTLHILRQLALLRIVTGDKRRARAALYHAIRMYDSARSQFAASEEEHGGIFAVYRWLIELMLLIAVDEQWPDESFDLIENAKARFWSERVEKLVNRDSDAAIEVEWHEGTRESQDHRITRINDSVIDPECLFISFFVGPNYSFVVTSHASRVESHRLDVTETELLRLAELWQQGLRSSSRKPLWRERAVELSSLLLPGNIAEFSEIRQMAIAPDGPLWFVPLDLLVALKMSQGAAEQPPFVGASAFNIPSAKLIDRYRASARSSGKLRIGIIARSVFTSSLPDLPCVATETSSISELGSDHQIAILSDSRATRANVLEMLESADIIHIATHALASADESESSVVLADDCGNDHKLAAADIAKLNIQAQLVFLSACSSAIGRISVGEGLMSIARAFLLGGSRCVIGALWPVNDVEASIFVKLFYQELLDCGLPAEALLAAKRQALAGGMLMRSIAAFQMYGGASPATTSADIARILAKRAKQS